MNSIPSGKDKGRMWPNVGSPVTAGPDTPVRVSGKHTTRAHRGDEAGMLLQGP